MPWLQISCEVERAALESVEAAFLGTGALSVTLGDAGDAPVLEPGPGETPLWPRVRVTALYEEQVDALPIQALLTGLAGGPDAAGISATVLEDRIWEREWLDQFGPMRFGRRLWVCPGGQDPDDDDAVVVRLDPGLAFGTGTHPTTHLCLEWLDRASLTEAQVVDYGCGSGILAIAAARLGARRVIAVDNDPQALIATRSNAADNDVSVLIETCDPASMPRMAADTLLANILAGPLIELAPRFADALRPGGRLVLSGILESQGPDIVAAYERWFELDQPASRDGWLCLGGTRRPEES